MSTANYRTQSFHDARNKILELTNEKKIKSKEDLSKVLEEEGYEVNDFLNEEQDYVNKLRETEGKFDPRARTTAVGRTAGALVGKAVRGTGDIFEAFAPNVYASFEKAAEPLIGALPTGFKDILNESFDPYHGSGLGATVEDTISTIGSYFIPYTGLLKATNAARMAPGARSLVNKVSQKLSRKQKQYGKFAGKAGLFGAAVTIAEDPLENTVNTVTTMFPESLDYLKKYSVDPTDTKSKQYLDALTNNLSIEGVFGAAGITTAKLLSAFNKTFGPGIKDVAYRVPLVKKLADITSRNFTSRRGTDDNTLHNLLAREGAAQEAAYKAQGAVTQFKDKAKNINFNINDETKLEQLNNLLKGGMFKQPVEEIVEEGTTQGTLRPGMKVRASDRNNIGTVREIREDGVLVNFVSPEGLTQDVVLQPNQLSKLTKKRRVIRGRDGEPELDIEAIKNVFGEKYEEILPDLQLMRKDITDLSTAIRDRSGGKFAATLDKNLDVYLNTSYKIFDDPAYRKELLKKVDNPDQVINDALQYIDKELKITDPELQKQALRELITSKGANNFLSSINSSKPFFKFNTIKGSSSKVTLGKKDFDKSLKALYGEVKDPFKNYVNTVEKLSTLKAEQDFLYDVADDLVSRGVARKVSKGDRIPDSFVDVETIAQERLNKIFGQNLAGKKKMLVIDPDDKEVISSFMSKPNIKNPFQDVYVDENYARLIKEGLGDYKTGNILIDTYAGMKGITQLSKTVYNPGTHGRNTMGNIFLLAANGIVPFKSKEFYKGIQTIGKKLAGKTDREFGELLGKYKRLGITDTGVGLGLIKDNLKNLGDRAEDFVKKNSLGKATAAPKYFNNKLVNLYQAEDDVFKIIHFEETKKMLKGAYPNATEEFLEKEAALRTRDLMPNYALVPKVVKATRILPVGDFVAFPAEMIRVSKNLVGYTLKDLASGNPILMEAGAKRLAGITLVGMGGDYLKNKSMQLMGISADQDEAINNTVPHYVSNYSRIYTTPVQQTPDGNVVVDFVNLGPIDPFEYIKSAARATHTYINEGDDDFNGTARNKFIKNILTKQLDPFFGPSMAVEAFGDAIKKIQAMEPSDSPFQVAGEAIFDAAKQSIQPGFFPLLQRQDQFYRSQAERGEGREIYSSGFRSIGPGDVDILNYLGVRNQRHDITRSANYNLKLPLRSASRPSKELNDLLRRGTGKTQERTLAGRIAGTEKPVTKKDLIKAYLKANQNRAVDYAKIKALLEDYRRLGLSKDDLERSITFGGRKPDEFGPAYSSTLSSIINNQFVPVEPPVYTDFSRDMSPVTDFPSQEFNQIYETLKRNPIE